MPFKPGVSGNPLGRPKKGDSMADTLRGLGNVLIEYEGETISQQEAICRKLMDMALDGDKRAILMIMDRCDGKPVAQVRTEYAEPILEIRRIIVEDGREREG